MTKKYDNVEETDYLGSTGTGTSTFDTKRHYGLLVPAPTENKI